MNCDFYCEQPTFHTIGMLREILKDGGYDIRYNFRSLGRND